MMERLAMASKRTTKVHEFQPSREINRIMPCKGGYAYISDQFGKTHHLKFDSEQFAEVCLSADNYFEGRITKELEKLGWNSVLQLMDIVSARQS